MANVVLVDSNVILDVITEDDHWFSWSSETLSHHADHSLLGINPIVYAEISVGFQRIEDLEAALLPGFFTRMELPWEAAFLAGKCFLKYRKGRGTRRSPLPDFYIGAHAAVLKVPLITRDAARYKTYFPSLKVICP